MAGEWTETTLGDAVVFLSGGTPSKARADYWGGAIPWVSAKDMKRFRLEDTEDHVTEDGAANGTKVMPAGTVLLLVRGMTLLNDVPICVAGRTMAFNQDVKALRHKSGVRNEFLPYLLLGHKERLLSSVDLAGHGTGRLNSDELKGLDVLLPPEPEQRAIAHILGTLDDKIEVNRKMNATLEAMARALFTSWFVDGTQTGLPQGWREGKVGDLATLNRDGLNPGEYPGEIFDHYSIPAFDEGRTPKPENGDTIKSNKFIVSRECVLLSKLNPRIPRVWLPDLRGINRAICSMEFLVTIPRPGVSREFLFGLFTSEVFAGVFTTMVTGTSGSHQRVKSESLLNIDAVIPPPSAIRSFTETSAPLLKRINHNIDESRDLASLRDTLLPKLISGEMRVARGAD